MGYHYGTTGMWYKDGIFYELQDTHVNFFLNNFDKLGFTKDEKEKMCVENDLSPDAVECTEKSQQRTDIILEVLKRGAIRIRFYGGSTSVQCYKKDNKKCFQELKNCIIDGYNKCFGNIITVMDCFGWGETINDMGWGTQIKDFVASSKHEQDYHYIDCSKEDMCMNGYERNQRNLNTVLNNRLPDVYSLIECKINLERLIKKHGDNGFAIISACKNPEEYPDWNNEEHSDKLEKDIQNEGYSYTVGWGGYEGIDNDTFNASYEKSFIVYNYISHDNWHNDKEIGDINRLREFAVDMCRKYQQESVYFKEEGKPPVWLNEEGQVVSKRSSDKIWKNDASKPFFTSLKDESAVDKELREKLKHFYKIQIQKENRPYNEDEFEEFYQKNKGNRDIVKNLGRRYTADIESAYDVFMSCGINFINRQALGFQSRYRQACRGEIGIRPDND